MEQTPQSQLKLLVAKGKEQGYLTYSEVNDHLPQDIVDSDQIEDIIQMINDMGIQVVESAPDADDLLLTENSAADEDAAEAAAQVLASVESEIGRTTDPVRMYMREMGTVELLTREGEIDIAKRIEDGINQVQSSVAEYPEAITYLLDQFDRFEAGHIRLGDIISGFVSEEDDLSAPGSTIGSELDDDEESDSDSSDDDDEDEDEDGDSDSDSDDDSGPDPEVAREKFAALREQHEKTRDAIKASGRESEAAKEQIDALANVFKEFRLVPKQFERLVNSMRDMMERVRVQERLIMRNCVEYAKMPKKNFVTAFTNNESSNGWFEFAKGSGKPWSTGLERVDDEVQRCIQKLQQVEQETGLTIRNNFV